MEKRMNDKHSGYIQICDSVALRLKEFSNVTGHNPDHMADMILTQWMDQQVQMYGDKWTLSGDKGRRMAGASDSRS